MLHFLTASVSEPGLRFTTIYAVGTTRARLADARGEEATRIQAVARVGFRTDRAGDR